MKIKNKTTGCRYEVKATPHLTGYKCEVFIEYSNKPLYSCHVDSRSMEQAKERAFKLYINSISK